MKELVVLILKNKNGNMSRFLVYKSNDLNSFDYLVIGNVDNLYTQDKIESLKRIIKELSEVLKLNSSNEQFLNKLHAIKTLPDFDKVLFTQEGFDLLNGKSLAFKIDELPKTVIVNIADLGFDNIYDLDKTYKISSVTTECGKKEINYFDLWEVYEEIYFFNSFDLNILSSENIKDYVNMNYERILKFLKYYFANWSKKHWDNFDEISQKEVIPQLADVIYSLSIERHNKR